MAAKDFDLLALYWKQEPWGPWRDNMHAAIIAREIRRPWVKSQSKNKLADFLIRDPEERAEDSSKKMASFFSFFQTIATKVKPKKRAKSVPSYTMQVMAQQAAAERTAEKRP